MTEQTQTQMQTEPNPTPQSESPETFASLSAKWIEAKEYEKQTAEYRRSIEDQLVAMLEIKEQDKGSQTVRAEGYKIVVKKGLTQKVDADKLQEVAQKHGLMDFLSTLFSWTPSIKAKEWKAADINVTRILSEAITTKAGRPTFEIELDEKKEAA